MSIRVMELVWAAFPGNGSELLAMLVMANWSDDQGGNLFPSIATVAKRIRTSESQARRVLHQLIATGWLTVVGNASGGAPGTTRRYALNVEKLAATGGATATPRMGATPRINTQDESHGCEKTASTGATQYVKQQPSVDVIKIKVPHTPMVLPDWLPATVWREWDDYRRANKGRAWTKKAQELTIKTLAKLHSEGYDPSQVVNQSIERGWSGLFQVKAQQQGGTQEPRPCLTEQSARLNRQHDQQEGQRHERDALLR